MKNIFIVFLSLLLFLYSCEPTSNEIKIIGENTSTIAAITKIKGKYENAKGIKVTTFPYEYSTLLTKSTVDIAKGDNSYDIIMQYNFALSSYVRNNYVFKIDEMKKGLPDSLFAFESDLFQNTWQEVGSYYDLSKNDGSMIKVGYPFASNSMILVYNKKMFENPLNKAEFLKKYGQPLCVPVSWEQYYNVAEFFTKKNDKEEPSFGLCMEGASNSELYYEFVNYLFSIGNGVLEKKTGWEGDEKTKVIINSDKNLKALDFYLSLKKFNKGDYFNVDQPLQTKLFKEGDVAMAIMWSDLIYPQIYKSNNVEDNRFGYAPIPGNKSFIGGGSYYINRKSKNPKEAFKFVLWLLNKENQIEMAKQGLCSPRKSVYENKEVQKIPYINALKTSLERGVYMMEAGPDADKISQIITKYVQFAWKNEINSKEALKNMQNDIIQSRAEIYKNIK
ncbi:MAG: extracellular solute-binding protein [Bacteroidetes bacterium]|nr:extracellular solute-binding protein [Bacteroidota bacterium]